ncbi:MAG: M15 family metallopeptidase [Defluviitaleaceae bacterium]|nr:M15 family metallopeptidase [Defluviitaleaceae bacterium]
MDTKKTTTITVAFVIVIATVSLIVIMAWLGANLPDTGNLGSGDGDSYMTEAYPYPPYETNYSQEMPVDTSQAAPDESTTGPQDDTPEGTNEYLPPDNYGSYSNGDTDEYEYLFTPIFKREPLPEHIIQQITGVTFHETTPFGYDYLTYLTVTHVNFIGESVLGHLIVAASIGYEVLDIFREIYEGGFPIYSIKLIDYFDASDYLSMAANNSHAFNFRYIAGTTIISRHGFGMAIDINPVQNPYIREDVIWPAAGAEYLDRSYVRPGMIVPGGVAYNAFMSRGWIWGGYWTLPRDYHHFERR